MYYNDNLAYDFETVEPSIESERNAKYSKNARPKNKTSKLRLVLCITAVVVIVACFVGKMWLSTVSTELTAQINSSKSEISKLKSEETRLKIEVESLVSYDNLDSAAKDLGMKKKEASQTVYVNGENGDKGLVVDNSESGNIFSVFAEWF